jgi:hypothetical protein
MLRQFACCPKCGVAPEASGQKLWHLTERELEALIAAAKWNRNGHRDGTMVLVGFRPLHPNRTHAPSSLQNIRLS